MSDGERKIEDGKHTPGPWEYGMANNYEGFYVAPRGTLPTLAAVERCGPHRLSVSVHNFPGETEANAKLIAAAPELLEVCRAALDSMDRTTANSVVGGSTTVVPPWVQRMRDVIGKATK